MKNVYTFDKLFDADLTVRGISFRSVVDREMVERMAKKEDAKEEKKFMTMHQADNMENL